MARYKAPISPDHTNIIKHFNAWNGAAYTRLQIWATWDYIIHHFQRHIPNMWVWLTGSMQRMTRTMPEPNMFASVSGPTSSWRGPSVAPHTVWAYPSPTLGAWRTQSQWGSISVQKILHSALLHTATHTVHYESLQYHPVLRYREASITNERGSHWIATG